MKNKIIGIFVCILLISGVFFSIVNAQKNIDAVSNEVVLNGNESTIGDSFDKKVKLLMRITNIPSLSACIVKNDTIIWSKAYGFSNIYKMKQAKIDTIYKIASITKTFTATAILQLYEKGFLDLDDNVSEYLPFDLKNPKYPDINITFRMLLSHQSSFYCMNVESLFAPLEPFMWDTSPKSAVKWYLFTLIHIKDLFSGFYPKEIYPWIKEVMIPGGSLYYPEHWGDYPPGEGYYYTNIGYSLLGYLIEQISGQNYEDYCYEHILEPLGMKNSSYFINDYDKEDLAVPYLWLHNIYFPIRHYEYNCLNPAGGLFTNTNDLSKYLIAHMNGGVYKGIRILNESTIEEMHKIQYPDGYYGLGWYIFKDNDSCMEGHTGQLPGFGSMMYSYSTNSTEKLGIIYFWNENIYGTPAIGFFRRLKDIVLRENLWDIFLEKAVE
jgi:CubicO group peptidase (beta-lactamase class C family)